MFHLRHIVAGKYATQQRRRNLMAGFQAEFKESIACRHGNKVPCYDQRSQGGL